MPSSCLLWTELEVGPWHRPTLFIMTTHTEMRAQTHTLTYAHTCSVQNRVTAKTDQFSSFPSSMNCDGLISLFDDQKSLFNILWVFARLTSLLLLFSVYGNATLFSAVFFTQPFCLDNNNKMYYIHFWIMCFFYCTTFSYLSFQKYINHQLFKQK